MQSSNAIDGLPGPSGSQDNSHGASSSATNNSQGYHRRIKNRVRIDPIVVALDDAREDLAARDALLEQVERHIGPEVVQRIVQDLRGDQPPAAPEPPEPAAPELPAPEAAAIDIGGGVPEPENADTTSGGDVEQTGAVAGPRNVDVRQTSSGEQLLYCPYTQVLLGCADRDDSPAASTPGFFRTTLDLAAARIRRFSNHPQTRAVVAHVQQAVRTARPHVVTGAILVAKFAIEHLIAKNTKLDKDTKPLTSEPLCNEFKQTPFYREASTFHPANRCMPKEIETNPFFVYEPADIALRVRKQVGFWPILFHWRATCWVKPDVMLFGRLRQEALFLPRQPKLLLTLKNKATRILADYDLRNYSPNEICTIVNHTVLAVYNSCVSDDLITNLLSEAQVSRKYERYNNHVK